MNKRENEMSWWEKTRGLFVLLEKYRGLFVLVVGIVVTAAVTKIYTSKIYKGYGWSEMGQLGDVIGGTTAPYIGVMSAILVYFALRSQVQANELIQKELREERKRRSFDNLFNQIIDVKSDLKDIEFTKRLATLARNHADYNSDPAEISISKGLPAVHDWMVYLRHKAAVGGPEENLNEPGVHRQIMTILYGIEYIALSIRGSDLEEADREVLKKQISGICEAYFYSVRKKCEFCANFPIHRDNPRELQIVLDSIVSVLSLDELKNRECKEEK